MVTLARAIFKTDVRRTPGRRGCRRDDYLRPRRFDRPTPLPRRGRSTILARYARSSIPGPTWSARPTAPRRAASAGIAPALRAVTIPAGPRTTFRCVAGEPTRSATSPLTRLAPSRCRRPPPGYVTELAEPSSAPSPPALPTRDGDRFCKRSSPAPPPRYVTEGAREESTFRANRSGIARATVVGHADGGRPRDEDPALSWRLRETRAAAPPTPLAVWLSPPQRFALVVPRLAHGTCVRP